MEPFEIIAVGIVHLFALLQRRGGYGLFRKAYKDGTDRISYIIALVPPIQARGAPPSSVLAEFASEAEALRVFARWKADPLLTKPARRKKKRLPDTRQIELPLGADAHKTKAQLEFEALHRNSGGTPS